VQSKPLIPQALAHVRGMAGRAAVADEHDGQAILDRPSTPIMESALRNTSSTNSSTVLPCAAAHSPIGPLHDTLVLRRRTRAIGLPLEKGVPPNLTSCARPHRGMVMGLCPHGRVLCQELLHTGLGRRQGSAFLPFRDELGVGE
jgi:hypothetical protein